MSGSDIAGLLPFVSLNLIAHIVYGIGEAVGGQACENTGETFWLIWDMDEHHTNYASRCATSPPFFILELIDHLLLSLSLCLCICLRGNSPIVPRQTRARGIYCHFRQSRCLRTSFPRRPGDCDPRGYGPQGSREDVLRRRDAPALCHFPPVPHRDMPSPRRSVGSFHAFMPAILTLVMTRMNVLLAL